VVERSDDGGGHWSPVATVNAWPGALTCPGPFAGWLGFIYGEHGDLGSLAATSDGGGTWRASVGAAPTARS